MPDNCAPKWSTWTLNKSLLNDLRKTYGRQEFTCKDAYAVYALRVHQKVVKSQTFQGMNVRNTLAKAAYEGVLVRVRRGVYKF